MSQRYPQAESGSQAQDSPSRRPTSAGTAGVGIIGLGVRGLYSMARLMAEFFPQTGLKITALCDRNPQRMPDGAADAGALLDSRQPAQSPYCRDIMLPRRYRRAGEAIPEVVRASDGPCE